MLRDWWNIQKAARAAKRFECDYAKEIAKAKKEHRDRQAICELQSEAAATVQPAWAERDYLVTSQLLRQARLLNLPVPDYGDDTLWIPEDQYHSRRTLTDEGITVLRKAIREERLARGFYAKVIFTSIISTILAIAAIITAIAKL